MQIWAQSFEVATIKPTDPKNGAIYRIQLSTPQTLEATGSVARLIMIAYGLQEYQVIGAPRWAAEDRFDIVAKASTPVRPEKMRLMLQALLAERFGLAIHREERPIPVYSLVVDQGGPKMKAPDADKGFSTGRTYLRGTISMQGFADRLTPIVGKPVKDETGLKGIYAVNLQWTLDDDGLGPSLFTLLREQLGLRLESAKRPIEVLVIDKVERPSDN